MRARARAPSLSRASRRARAGRLHQVEYAVEAINNAGTAVGILAADGIVLAGEKQAATKLIAPSKSSEKTYKLDDHVACIVAGLSADANILIQQARVTAQRYLYTYQEPMPIEQLTQRVCNQKQAYTQYGGLRPFGVKFLFAGYDKHLGFQLYMSDPSGNYGGWKATCVGQNDQAGQSLLKNEYAPDMSVEAALKLAVKVMNKTMDTTTPAPDKMEFFTLTRDASGAIVHTTMTEEQTAKLLEEVQAEAAPEGDL